MPAEFREILPNSGFSDDTPTRGPGIVIPYRGSNSVVLAGGKGLKLVTAMRPMLGIDETKNPSYYQYTPSTWTALTTGELRIIKITGHSLVGFDRAKIEAIDPRTKKAEATLKVLVLKQKRVKIAIRPVQVRDDRGALVNSSRKPIDVDLLLRQMNSIWTPQANIVFELTRPDPVTIDGLRLGADAHIEKLKPELVAKKDPDAALTFFMVRRAVSQEEQNLAVVDAEAGISLISDDRSESTMAHEAGHFLGSLSEAGKFTMRYGHQGTDPKLLMRFGGAGHKIPYEIVTNFNYGYRS